MAAKLLTIQEHLHVADLNIAVERGEINRQGASLKGLDTWCWIFVDRRDDVDDRSDATRIKG